jgi:hypothetical protein
MQEPASVAFSIANGLMHWRGIRAFRRQIAPGNPLRSLYLAWGVAGVNTWVWSTIFHIRGPSLLGRAGCEPVPHPTLTRSLPL